LEKKNLIENLKLTNNEKIPKTKFYFDALEKLDREAEAEVRKEMQINGTY
jgi:hypothetical protein